MGRERSYEIPKAYVPQSRYFIYALTSSVRYHVLCAFRLCVVPPSHICLNTLSQVSSTPTLRPLTWSIEQHSRKSSLAAAVGKTHSLH